MLSLCEALGMRINFVAPAFGFQKNTPYPDNDALRALIEQQWAVCRAFDASIGFHSGSGKSAENYQVMGAVTGGHLEIKTSGRYTYEMGVALSTSKNPADAPLWRDWYRFTLDMAIAGAFSDDATEQKMARTFISTSPGRQPGGRWCTYDLFDSPASCRGVLEALPPSPEYMFFFEYNFLYVLAAGGRPDKTALGDHSPAGYAQRARFYAISPEARLNYSKAVADYIVFLAASHRTRRRQPVRDGRRTPRTLPLARRDALGDLSAHISTMSAESAVRHPLHVERHRLRVHHACQPRILHHLPVDAIAIGARLIDDPGKHDDFAGPWLRRLS